MSWIQQAVSDSALLVLDSIDFALMGDRMGIECELVEIQTEMLVGCLKKCILKEKQHNVIFQL